MNSVKLHDTKSIHINVLHFYPLTMEDQKGKVTIAFHEIAFDETISSKNKIHRNKPT